MTTIVVEYEADVVAVRPGYLCLSSCVNGSSTGQNRMLELNSGNMFRHDEELSMLIHHPFYSA